jgi:hypothetical protein
MNSLMETVCSVCNKVQTANKKGATFPQVLKSLRKEFKIHDIQLKIRSKKDKSLNPTEFYVHAYYDSYDDQNFETPIEVIAHNNFDKEYTWDTKQVKDFLIQVYDAVVHEKKHQRQSKKRNHEQYWNHPDGGYHYREYLQDPDEIDAYAVSIAIELCRTLGKHRALRYMGRFTTLARMKLGGEFVSPNLNAYVSHFEQPVSPLLRRLAKKVYTRLKKIDTDYIFQ